MAGERPRLSVHRSSKNISVQLIDDQEHLLSLTKADLREYTILKTSPMPSFKDSLSTDELSDVVAYLLSLKGL